MALHTWPADPVQLTGSATRYASRDLSLRRASGLVREWQHVTIATVGETMMTTSTGVIEGSRAANRGRFGVVATQ
ncbi:MAG: hypothetical protein SF182_20615 [Deltaproteobacteria bacterium]|nr:hypothetical protein [Deltaproteobacteria bacterium]